jgi:hemerythrin-like domain-containing protein
MNGPTHRLSKEHVVILRALERFEHALDGFHVEMVRETLRFFDEKVLLHRRKEEEALFPAVAKHIGPQGPIACMLHEHGEEKRCLEAIRAALGGPLSPAAREAILGAGRAILSLLRAHIAKEDGVLFPLSEEVLSADEKTSIQRAFDAIGYADAP